MLRKIRITPSTMIAVIAWCSRPPVELSPRPTAVARVRPARRLMPPRASRSRRQRRVLGAPLDPRVSKALKVPPARPVLRARKAPRAPKAKPAQPERPAPPARKAKKAKQASRQRRPQGTTRRQAGTRTPGTPGATGQPWTPDNVLPSGATETGAWSARPSESQYVTSTINFPIALAGELEQAHVHLVPVDPEAEGTGNLKNHNFVVTGVSDILW